MRDQSNGYHIVSRFVYMIHIFMKSFINYNILVVFINAY
jgi:hypothetical protein